jgi:transcriptional regulator
MYLPKEFKQDDPAALRAALARPGLATLVSLGTEGIEASHVPMLHDEAPAPFGRLCGHIARANPQWRRAVPGSQALAIFLGPDAYVSPAWYETKRRTGKVVPTWNYAAIHAYGALSFFDEPARLLALVTRLTERSEAPRPAPWAVGDAPADYIGGMLKGIVGFELAIARLEGKWKMSQNRPAEDQAGVIAGLAREGGPAEAAVAEVMRGLGLGGAKGSGG